MTILTKSTGTRGTSGAGALLQGFSRPHPLPYGWGIWDLLETIFTNKNPFNHNSSFKLGFGLKVNEGIAVGFFSLS